MNITPKSARLGNLTRPNIGKRRMSDPQYIKICGKDENIIECKVEFNHRIQDIRIVPYLYASENNIQPKFRLSPNHND